MSRFPVVVDIETTGLDFTHDSIRLIGIGCDERYEVKSVHEALPILHGLRDSGAVFVMQNGKFDTKFLWKNGIFINCDFDTMLAARCLKQRPHSLSLDALASFYLGLPSWKGDVDFLTSDLNALGEYCITDCQVTMQLYDVLSKALVEEGQDQFFRNLMQAAKMLTAAEYHGMSVDWAALRALTQRLSDDAAKLSASLLVDMDSIIGRWRLDEIEKKAQKTKDPQKARMRLAAKPPEFNLGSPKQILWALKESGADVMKWDQKKRANVESSADDVLQKNKSKISWCSVLSDLREAEKLRGALEGYQEIASVLTEKIHCNFNLQITETGRLSSSNPNLQNVDRSERVRGLFIPRHGQTLLIGDLAQIEVRMAAHYSRDPKLIEMFEKGEDFYGKIATEILGATCTPNDVKTRHPELRRVAKVIGLSILYGVGPNKLRDGIALNAGIEFSYLESKGIIENYFKKFEGLKDLRRRVDQKLTADGFLTGLFGRRLYIRPDDIYMKGVNYLLQNSASDLMLFRQVELDELARKEGLNQNLISLVHDEFLREVAPAQAARLQELATTTLERRDDIEFRVPLKVECVIGSSWAAKH